MPHFRKPNDPIEQERLLFHLQRLNGNESRSRRRRLVWLAAVLLLTAWIIHLL